MKKLTKKKLVAGVMTLGVLGLFALPTIVGAAGDIPKIEQLTTLKSGNLTDYINKILTVVFGILGVIAVLIILWAGFIWMTAGGEPDKVDKAKKMIYAGITGLIIIFASGAIARFVMSKLEDFTSGT